MKRKADKAVEGKSPVKKKSKTSLSGKEAKQRFRKGLFDQSVLDGYTKQYAESTPYKHSVITTLVDDKLLRSVRDEIRANVSFTPKETDIYKIHQSGDLANLDGLDDEALSKLPSLLALRDAIYSEPFRTYVSYITQCGPLSGRKTDMAINVYTPGCYLLCHDDVIGSRRVSYILYLTDPDTPWQAEWGGALRLFPTVEQKGEGGEKAITPTPDVVKVIPPAWNQLSFFAVQPGLSFHDVEQVYHAADKAELEKNGGRVRMAISGWFHIPQEGEEGYEAGAEEAQARNSGLMQLQGNPDQHDRPSARPVPVPDEEQAESQEFDEADLEFLLKYIAPTYLTPDTLEGIGEHFEENSSITLAQVLSKKFAARLREYVEAQEKAVLPSMSKEIENKSDWKVARPPHKHRFLYRQPGDNKKNASPVDELINVLLPSNAFRAWLQKATGCIIESTDVVARRFRKGEDYTLATGHDGKPTLEMNLGFTPTKGWGDEDDEEAEEAAEEEGKVKDGKSKDKGKDKGKDKDKAKVNGSSPKAKSARQEEEKEEPQEPGGHEVYMAGDDDAADNDAAVYRSSAGPGEEDDNILFFQAAAWNKMTLVLRDSGTLRFVKYVSKKAPGDRWDISGVFQIREDEDVGEEKGNGEGSSAAVGVIDDTSEEEFRGFSPSEDSDSD